MDSRVLAQLIEETDSISKPWYLVLLRLKKLQERKELMHPGEYVNELESLHKELMSLGEWWIGIEDEVFNP